MPETNPLLETFPQQVLVAPPKYSIPDEGDFRRWLFVGEEGRVRSATAQVLASRININARAVGSNIGKALQIISLPLIYWAERIIFMDDQAYQQAQDLLASNNLDKATMVAKATILSIPKTWPYMTYDLMETLKQQLPELALTT